MFKHWMKIVYNDDNGLTRTFFLRGRVNFHNVEESIH